MGPVVAEWFKVTVVSFETMSEKQKSEEQKSKKTIDWTNSESKQIVWDDLEAGIISIDTTDKARDLYFGMYCHIPEFILEGVTYEQFRNRLNDHRKVFQNRAQTVSRECAALAHDRLLYPQRSHNDRGEKIFHLTEAFQLLKQDVANKLHKKMKPSKLKQTRAEYADFSLQVFDRKIRQAVRRERLINWLNDKREEAIMQRREHRKELGLPEETPMEKYKRNEDL